MSLHRKQAEILEFLTEFTKKHGYPPSVREICAAVNLKSPSTAHSHLRKIEAAGLISIDPNKTRAIRLSESHISGVPIIGRVTAGRPILAFEQDYGTLPYQPNGSGEHFALEVYGDSMSGAGILDGDFVVIRKQNTALHGEIVAARLEDEATIKRFWRKQGKILLMPENPSYEPIEGDDCEILGKVTAVVREI